MELADDDPRLIKSAEELVAKLQPFVGRHFDAGNLGRICELVQRHRAAFRRTYGADFPPLVPFVLPSLKFIHFVRADIEDREIYIQLRNLLVQLSHRRVLPSEEELDEAVRLCWPGFRPPIEEFRSDPYMQRLH